MLFGALKAGRNAVGGCTTQVMPLFRRALKHLAMEEQETTNEENLTD